MVAKAESFWLECIQRQYYVWMLLFVLFTCFKWYGTWSINKSDLFCFFLSICGWKTPLKKWFLIFWVKCLTVRFINNMNIFGWLKIWQRVGILRLIPRYTSEGLTVFYWQKKIRKYVSWPILSHMGSLLVNIAHDIKNLRCDGNMCWWEL